MAKSMPSFKNSGHPTYKSSHSIRKISKEKLEREQALNKLRIMVGGGENCSQLEIMQSVIDYISYLRAQLTDDAENVVPSTSDTLVHQLVGRLTALLKN